MKSTVFITIMLIAFTCYGQITTTNRNIKEEVTNIDATSISNNIRNNSNNSLLLKKMANSSIVKQIKGVWSKPNEEDVFYNSISIPKIAFPGYVKVTLTQSDENLKPKMVISSHNIASGAIISGSSAQTNNEQARTAYFSVYPGMNYDVMVAPFFNAKNYPVTYNLKWEYFGKRDIYEPNDTQKQAKFIDFNKTISAFAIAGYIKNYIASNDHNILDWYSVVLKENKKIKITTLNTPSDVKLDVRIYDASGRALGISIKHDSITSSQNLSKGTYYIRMHIRSNSSSAFEKADNDTQPVPDHFTKPYSFIVNRL